MQEVVAEREGDAFEFPQIQVPGHSDGHIHSHGAHGTGFPDALVLIETVEDGDSVGIRQDETQDSRHLPEELPQSVFQ